MVFLYLTPSAAFALYNQSMTTLLMPSWNVKIILTLFYKENILIILSKFQSIILSFEQDSNLPPKKTPMVWKQQFWVNSAFYVHPS